MCAYIKKAEAPYITHKWYESKSWKKKNEQNLTSCEEVIIIRADINEMENKITICRLKWQGGSLKEINRIDKFLSKLLKTKTQINKTRNKEGCPNRCQWRPKLTSKYFQRLYTLNLENIEVMNKFLDESDLKLCQEARNI